MCTISEHAWRMITELRNELRESQKIRSQIIGVKIAFVAASLGFVVGGKEGPNYNLLLVPAFASIFFDFLIISYGVSIKRIGFYCRIYLEPKIREKVGWPFNEPLWEEAMSHKKMKQHFAGFGNIGLTAVVLIPAIVYLINEGPSFNNYYINLIIIFILFILFFGVIIFSYFWKYTPDIKLEWPPKKDESGQKKDCNVLQAEAVSE